MTLRTYVAIYFLLVFQDHHGASRRVDYYKICSLVITTYLLSCTYSCVNSIKYTYMNYTYISGKYTRKNY